MERLIAEQRKIIANQTRIIKSDEVMRAGHGERKAYLRGATTDTTKVPCAKCGKTNHTASQCWIDEVCARCGNKGHIARVCSTNGKEWLLCGSLEHAKFTCPSRARGEATMNRFVAGKDEDDPFDFGDFDERYGMIH